MDWQKFLDRFEFQDDGAFHNQIHSISAIEFYLFIDYGQRNLALESQATA